MVALVLVVELELFLLVWRKTCKMPVGQRLLALKFYFGIFVSDSNFVFCLAVFCVIV